jgi:excisionase family DNA binding protein
MRVVLDFEILGDSLFGFANSALTVDMSSTRDAYLSFLTLTDDPLSAAILTLADRVTPAETSQADSLTVSQVAERLNVAVNTVYSLCASRKLRHHRVGEGRGTIRITNSDLDIFRRSTQV